MAGLAFIPCINSKTIPIVSVVELISNLNPLLLQLLLVLVPLASLSLLSLELADLVLCHVGVLVLVFGLVWGPF